MGRVTVCIHNTIYWRLSCVYMASSPKQALQDLHTLVGKMIDRDIEVDLHAIWSLSDFILGEWFGDE